MTSPGSDIGSGHLGSGSIGGIHTPYPGYAPGEVRLSLRTLNPVLSTYSGEVGLSLQALKPVLNSSGVPAYSLLLESDAARSLTLDAVEAL